MIILPIISTSLILFSFRRLGECKFWAWEWKGWCIYLHEAIEIRTSRGRWLGVTWEYACISAKSIEKLSFWNFSRLLRRAKFHQSTWIAGSRTFRILLKHTQGRQNYGNKIIRNTGHAYPLALPLMANQKSGSCRYKDNTGEVSLFIPVATNGLIRPTNPPPAYSGRHSRYASGLHVMQFTKLWSFEKKFR